MTRSRMNRTIVMLLLGLLAGCAAREPRCDAQLRPINVAVAAAAAAGTARVRP